MATVIAWAFIAVVMYLWGAALFGQSLGQFLKQRRHGDDYWDAKFLNAVNKLDDDSTYGDDADPTDGRGSDVFWRR